MVDELAKHRWIGSSGVEAQTGALQKDLQYVKRKTTLNARSKMGSPRELSDITPEQWKAYLPVQQEEFKDSYSLMKRTEALLAQL